MHQNAHLSNIHAWFGDFNSFFRLVWPLNYYLVLSPFVFNFCLRSTRPCAENRVTDTALLFKILNFKSQFRKMLVKLNAWSFEIMKTGSILIFWWRLTCLLNEMLAFRRHQIVMRTHLHGRHRKYFIGHLNHILSSQLNQIIPNTVDCFLFWNHLFIMDTLQISFDIFHISVIIALCNAILCNTTTK